MIGHLGIEDYSFENGGVKQWQFRLGGGGGDAWLYRIYGHITGAPQPFANLVTNGLGFVRQSLTSLFVPATYYPQRGVGSVVSTQLPSSICQFDTALASWNLKQTGYDCPVLPVNIVYRSPIQIPSGILQIGIESQTESTYQGVLSTDHQQVVDTEIHLTFDWEMTPPAVPSSGGGGSGTADITSSLSALEEQVSPISMRNARISVRTYPP